MKLLLNYFNNFYLLYFWARAFYGIYYLIWRLSSCLFYHARGFAFIRVVWYFSQCDSSSLQEIWSDADTTAECFTHSHPSLMTNRNKWQESRAWWRGHRIIITMHHEKSSDMLCHLMKFHDSLHIISLTTTIGHSKWSSTIIAWSRSIMPVIIADTPLCDFSQGVESAVAFLTAWSLYARRHQ